MIRSRRISIAARVGMTIAAAVVLAPAAGLSAETAASIQYEFITRPAGLSSDFAPADGAAVKFLALKAIDGSTLEASLWQPDAKPAAETTLVVMVHGSGGSYRRAPQSGLGAGSSPTDTLRSRSTRASMTKP